MREFDKVYLITKADDVGSNASANKAFFDGCKKGILRNGVIMMTCSSAKAAAEFFKEEKNFCMGLHLTLNAEWDNVKWGPVLPAERVPSLVDAQGHFFQTTKALHENKPVLGEIMAEVQAQLDLAMEYGLNIRFADCHMGFSWVVPELEDELKEWCRKNGILYNLGDFERLPKEEKKTDPIEEFIDRLKAVKPGIYQVHMGHPAYFSEEMLTLGHQGYPGDVVAEEREWDRLRLMDERVLEFFSRNNIVPVTLEEAMRLSKP